MFLVTNFRIDKFDENINHLYFRFDKNALHKKTDKHIFLFEGWLYPDERYAKHDILNFFLKGELSRDFKRFKGKFSGIFIDLEKNHILFFNDQLGLKDIFYYNQDGKIAISNKFSEILNVCSFNYSDMDILAMNEFLLFDHALLDRTFIKSIKSLPLASIYDIKDGRLSKFNYWRYKFSIETNFDLNHAVKKLDSIFNKSMQRIMLMNGKSKTYGLGLSGGMDSRLVAFYAKKNGMKLRTFIFGEKNSDSYKIARKIANILGLEHKEMGHDFNFIKYAEKLMESNPHMNIKYSWYYSKYDELPKFDVLLCGFYGGELFGYHVNGGDSSIKNKKQLIKTLFNRFNDNKLVIPKYKEKSIFCDIERFVDNSRNSAPMAVIQEFELKQRQLKFIKDSPAFDFLGMYNRFSVFEDIDLVEYLLTIPHEWKVHDRLYLAFFRKLPLLLNIRPEGRIAVHPIKAITKLRMAVKLIDTEIFKTNLFYKKSHRELNKWIAGNDYFYAYCKRIINRRNDFFDKYFGELDLKKELDMIHNGKSINLQMFFRLLTLKLFFYKYIKKAAETT